MISLDRASYQVQPRYAEYAGLSTDVKPVESIDNSDEFQEIDTGNIYRFDVETSQWIQQPTGGGGGGTSNYNDLTNKPQINGITLTGDKTTEQLGINIPAELPNPFALTFTGAATAEYDGSGAVSVEIPEPSGGTTDYNELSNKPSINGVVLEGDKTTEQININIPTSLPNPNKLIFTGASTQEYDGSSEITVNIPNSEVTTSYNDLTDLPQINGIELIGNKTSAELGITFQQFEDIVLNQDVASVEISLPEKYNRLWFIFCLDSTSGQLAKLDMRFSNNSNARLQFSNAVHNISARDTVLYLEKVSGYYPIVIFGNNQGSSIPNTGTFAPNSSDQKIDWNPFFTSVTLYATGTEFASGGTIKIWGAE